MKNLKFDSPQEICTEDLLYELHSSPRMSKEERKRRKKKRKISKKSKKTNRGR